MRSLISLKYSSCSIDKLCEALTYLYSGVASSSGNIIWWNLLLKVVQYTIEFNTIKCVWAVAEIMLPTQYDVFVLESIVPCIWYTKESF